MRYQPILFLNLGTESLVQSGWFPPFWSSTKQPEHMDQLREIYSSFTPPEQHKHQWHADESGFQYASIQPWNFYQE